MGHSEAEKLLQETLDEEKAADEKLTSLAEGEISQPSAKYTGGKSTLGLPTYMGPCPPARR